MWRTESGIWNTERSFTYIDEPSSFITFGLRAKTHFRSSPLKSINPLLFFFFHFLLLYYFPSVILSCYCCFNLSFCHIPNALICHTAMFLLLYFVFLSWGFSSTFLPLSCCSSTLFSSSLIWISSSMVTTVLTGLTVFY